MLTGGLLGFVLCEIKANMYFFIVLAKFNIIYYPFRV